MMKKEIAVAALSLFTAFAPVANVTANDNGEPKTELGTESKLTAPKILKGDAGHVSTLSGLHNTVGIHLKGGKEGIPEKAAHMIAPLFADDRYTDKPMNIVFVYGDSGGDATAHIWFDGDVAYEIDPADIVKNIDNINELFLVENPEFTGNVLPIPLTTASLDQQ